METDPDKDVDGFVKSLIFVGGYALEKGNITAAEEFLRRIQALGEAFAQQQQDLGASIQRASQEEALEVDDMMHD